MSTQNISNPNPTGEYFKPQQKTDNILKWYFKTWSQNHSRILNYFEYILVKREFQDFALATCAE